MQKRCFRFLETPFLGCCCLQGNSAGGIVGICFVCHDFKLDRCALLQGSRQRDRTQIFSRTDQSRFSQQIALRVQYTKFEPDGILPRIDKPYLCALTVADRLTADRHAKCVCFQLLQFRCRRDSADRTVIKRRRYKRRLFSVIQEQNRRHQYHTKRADTDRPYQSFGCLFHIQLPKRNFSEKDFPLRSGFCFLI